MPGNFGTNKILTDRLETFREPNQNVNFQRDAMEVFRDHLKFLDIAMKRMKDKPAIFKVFPFNMMSKQNAERDKVRAEKTKYLNEVVASLDAHLTFIQENLLGNTISGVSGVYRQGLYHARLLPRDIKDLQRFSEAIKEGGKYERIMHLPAIQAIKQKDDQMLAQLPRNNAVAFNRQRNNAVAFNRPSSSRAQQEALARAT